MENWPALTGVAALAFFCDRLLVWMGERGWIYWRERAPSFAEAHRPTVRDRERAIRPPRRRRRRLGGRSRPRA
jgi:hypothetical protein